VVGGRGGGWGGGGNVGDGKCGWGASLQRGTGGGGGEGSCKGRGWGGGEWGAKGRSAGKKTILPVGREGDWDVKLGIFSSRWLREGGNSKQIQSSGRAQGRAYTTWESSNPYGVPSPPTAEMGKDLFLTLH